MSGVSLTCFFAGYGAALGLELWHHLRPRPVLRLLALGFGAAGLVAQTIHLDQKQPPLIWQFGWVLFLAWVLGIFYLYGSVHHRKLAWGVFVLPLILGLLALGVAFRQPPDDGKGPLRERVLSVQHLWGLVHAG